MVCMSFLCSERGVGFHGANGHLSAETVQQATESIPEDIVCKLSVSVSRLLGGIPATYNSVAIFCIY